ncbi:MAG: hypothetical protein ACRDK4_05580 [Solirubrobacteraceae bacterium]
MTDFASIARESFGRRDASPIKRYTRAGAASRLQVPLGHELRICVHDGASRYAELGAQDSCGR